MKKYSICQCCEKKFNWNDENSCWKCGCITCPSCTHDAECQNCYDNDIEDDDNLESKIVTVFHGGEYPEYRQGLPNHEFESIVTAEELNILISKIKKLEEENYQHNIKLDLN